MMEIETEREQKKKSLTERQITHFYKENDWSSLTRILEDLQHDVLDHVTKPIDVESLFTNTFKILLLELLEHKPSISCEAGKVLTAMANLMDTHHYLLTNFFDTSSPLMIKSNIFYEVMNMIIIIQKEQRFCQVFPFLYEAILNFLESNLDKIEGEPLTINKGLKYIKYIAKFQYPGFLIRERIFTFGEKLKTWRLRKTMLNIIGNLASHVNIVIIVPQALIYTYDSLLMGKELYRNVCFVLGNCAYENDYCTDLILSMHSEEKDSFLEFLEYCLSSESTSLISGSLHCLRNLKKTELSEQVVPRFLPFVEPHLDAADEDIKDKAHRFIQKFSL